MDVASSLVLDNLSIGLTSFKIAITVILYLIFAMKNEALRIHTVFKTQRPPGSDRPRVVRRELMGGP